MTETSEAADADSVVRISPPAFRAFYDLRRQTTPGASSAAGPRRSRRLDGWPGQPGNTPALGRRSDRPAAVREAPSIELGPDFRGQVHEFPQALQGEPAFFLKHSELQLALPQDFHDFVVLDGWLRHCPPRSQSRIESNIRALPAAT